LTAKIFNFSGAQSEESFFLSILRALGNQSQEEIDAKTDALRKQLLTKADHGLPDGVHIAKLDFGPHRIWMAVHVAPCSMGISTASAFQELFVTGSEEYDFCRYRSVSSENTKNAEIMPFTKEDFALIFDKVRADFPIINRAVDKEFLDVIGKIRVVEYLAKNNIHPGDEMGGMRAIQHATQMRERVRKTFERYRIAEGEAIREIETDS
jgi:hypothetical protein